jgi:hypothetical protein
MGYIDDTLHHLLNSLGIKSNSQLDEQDQQDRSAYLKKLPTRMTSKDVYLPAIQMQPEADDPRVKDWYKATQPIPMAGDTPQAEPSPLDLGDPYGREPLMQKLIDAEGAAGVEYPSAHGEKFGMMSTGHHTQPMSPQDAQDYIDFISPHESDDMADMPPAAIAAMRRRQ